MHMIVRIFYFVRFLLHNCFKKRIKRIFLKELMVFFHLRPRKWSFVEFSTLKFEFLTFQYFSSTENHFFGSKHEIMYSQAAWKCRNMFLLCKNVKIVLRECSVGPKSAKIRFLRQSNSKYIGTTLNISKKNHTTSESKALLTTFRREASLSDLSFGLGWDLRLRILGLMVEWSGE